jgi:aspartate racemase
MSDVIPLLPRAGSTKASKPRGTPRLVRADFRRRSDCVHQLFEAQVERTPDACAVVFKDRLLTYRELNEQANRVAHDLAACNVGPESLVALCVERSAEMFIGMLAVLKAGAAYVPLDPHYPDQRISTLMADAGPTAVLTQGHLAGRFSPFSQPVVELDGTADSISHRGRGNLASPLSAENLAYVIYTSGSTGQPKGVLITHGSLVNHNLAMANCYELTPQDRVLQFAAFTFDVAAEEIYPTWLSGGAVVGWPVTSGTAPIRSFLEFVNENRITVLNLPAAYWHEWVSELSRHTFPPSVRLVIVGSDKVSREKFSIWRKAVGDRVRLCNAYGPTEATITATVYEPREDAQPKPADCLPIGRPIANVKIFVLDDEKKPVPYGEQGELYIGGAGLARGYLNRPDLTREKFIDNPFRDGEWLYRTGDLARFLPDGNLEFLGRIDDQVKVRGFRIEVGEIEAALRQFPHARAAVVVAREDVPGEKRLVGYLAIPSAHRPSVETLKRFLRARLPEYMVPVDIVMLRQLPLTAGGKIDRSNLPRPELNRDAPGKHYVAPRNDLERNLVAIWEAMLGVKPVGIRDNFFELGGHSLMEIRLIGEIEKKLGLTLALNSLYHTRTIERLARMLEQKGAARPLVVPYRAEGTKPPVFSYGGSTHLAEYFGDDQPIYWLEIYGGDGSRVPARIEEAAAGYISEIRAIQPQGPYHLMGYCLGALMIFEIAQQLKRQGEQIALLALVSPALPPLPRAQTQDASEAKRRTLRDKLRSTVEPGKLTAARLLKTIGRIARKIPPRIRWAGRISKRSFCEVWLRTGRPLPLFLRDFYLVETGDELIERYVPQPYRGPVLLFRSLNDGTEAEWRSVIPEAEFHNSWVEHNEFLEEPYVKTIVGEIQKHLERGEGANGGASRPTTLGAQRSNWQPMQS